MVSKAFVSFRETLLTHPTGYIIILRAVTTTDFMTAEAYEFDFALLRKIATRIVNEVDGVSRVTYDITSKPPGEWTTLMLDYMKY